MHWNRNQGTIFKNAVLTSTSFVGADVENADFTEVRRCLREVYGSKAITFTSLLSNRLCLMFV